jgi:hypothetical protein
VVASATRVARIFFVALAVTGIWFLARYGDSRPEVRGSTAAADQFSAVRADQSLARILGPERPHPTASAENAAVRARVLAEFATLGTLTRILTAFTCNPQIDPQEIPCRTTNDVIAELAPGSGKAVLLMAHLDSVPAGPGASDDGANVASIVEIARALKSAPEPAGHPVLALITDGEEAGLSGSKAFTDDAALRGSVGVVINLEAGGSRGPSLLYQVNDASGPLLGLYGRSIPFHSANSLFQELYRLTPSDSDLTNFIEHGIPGYGFAWTENRDAYHTSLDEHRNLDLRSVQAQGATALALARALRTIQFDRLRGEDEAFADVFGRMLLHAPEWIFAPIGLVIAALLAAGLATQRRRIAPRDGAWSLLAGPLVVALAIGVGAGLHGLASVISGVPNPAHAHPEVLRAGLAAGVFMAALLAGRVGSAQALTLSCGAWLTGLGLAAALLAPGAAPLFLLPAAALTLASLPWPAWTSDALRAAAVLLAAALWMRIEVLVEPFYGLAADYAFTLPAGLTALAALPLLRLEALGRRAWMASCLAVGLGAVSMATIAGLIPAYSAAAPKRISLVYVEDMATRRAEWAVSTPLPLPKAFRRAARFSKVQVLSIPGRYARAYAAPAGAARLPPPSAAIVTDAWSGALRHVRVALHAPPGTATTFLRFPPRIGLVAVGLRERRVGVGDAGVTLSCLSLDCAEATYDIWLSKRDGFDLSFSANSYGLPAGAGWLQSLRGSDAVPSQDGDGVVRLNTLRIPASK